MLVLRVRNSMRSESSPAEEFRIEVHVGILGGIEEFSVQQKLAMRPDVAHEQRLAPAAMSQHKIRCEAFLLQRAQHRATAAPRATRSV